LYSISIPTNFYFNTTACPERSQTGRVDTLGKLYYIEKENFKNQKMIDKGKKLCLNMSDLSIRVMRG